jgi:rare lipoprotein A
MRSIDRGGGLIAGAALLLSGCGSFEGTRGAGPTAGPAPSAAANLVSDTPVKLGNPYAVGGVTYAPVDVADYDAVGYASWYGDELAGKPTANGEKFDPARISAAHKTLPLPSYVEVTALDTGRTILVRVNDRGPMANDRLIDLSRAAAEQLGLSSGVAAVRVRRTNPPAAERAQLRAGKPVPERIVTPQSLLAILRAKAKKLPVPAMAPAAAVTIEPPPPVASAKAKPGDDRIDMGTSTAKPAASASPAKDGNIVVQVAAFSSEARADATATAVGGAVSRSGNLWRVRMGPFASQAEAQAALDRAKAKGFRDAMLLHDR